MRRVSIPLFLGLLAACPVHAAEAPSKAAAKTAPAVRAPRRAVTPGQDQADPFATLIEKARGAQAAGQDELAIRMAQSAIVADPARTDGYVALGDVYAAQGQADYARSYYDLALSIDPAAPAALNAIAALQTQRQARNEAQNQNQNHAGPAASSGP